MKVLHTFLIACLFFTRPIFALGPPLHVGITSYDPPFVSQGANNIVFGFDIDMINYVCQSIQRTCQFHVMPFHALLDAVANKEIDVAVRSITITPERAQIVNFSIPYLLSYSRFLTNSSTAKQQPFTMTQLQGARIGVEEGTIFTKQISTLPIKNLKITEYSGINNALVALKDGDVDYLLLDNLNAIYWKINSSGAFTTVGVPYLYGYGYGIAVNKSDLVLLNAINQALVHYQASPQYIRDYKKYIAPF